MIPALKKKGTAINMLKKSLQERGHLVYLSRIQDVTKSLQERASLADQVKADFFLSLHFNASEIKEHNGFEMYYLDNASNKAIKKIESVENNEKLTSDHDLNKLLLDIIVTQTSQQSKFIAREIENNFIKSITPKHHVRLRKTQAGLFYVLALSQRPSLLLEAGFMSHLVELKKIEQDEYLQDLSEVIAKAMTSDK